MVDSQTVKDYLRLDTDEDISFFIASAEEYFYDSVGIYPNPDKVKHIHAICAITQELYDNRTMMGSDKPERMRHVIRSILDHIRMDLEGGDLDEG